MADNVVMAAGVFDLLHLGHIHYLEEAKSLGDELVVVVACDETVRKNKHEPLMTQDVRAEMVGSLKPVDEVRIGYPGDMFKIVKEISPDIIALGYDQRHDADMIRSELDKRGMDTEVMRMGHYDNDLNGTRKIIRKIIDWYSMKKNLERVEGT